MFTIRFAGQAAIIFLMSALASSSLGFPSRVRQKPTTPAQTPKPEKQDDSTILRVRTEGDSPDETTVIRMRTQLVVVPFTVTDRQNRYVNTLKPDDLRLYEDGREIDIVELGRTSEAPLALALLVDFSGSMQGRLAIARRTAVRFLEKVLRLKEDQAGLLAFQQEVVPVCALTHDVERLRKSLNEVDLRLPSPVGRVMPFDPTFQATGTALNAAIYLAVDDILARSTVPNARRVIVLLTDGYDGDGSVQLREAIDRAWRSGVSVYALGVTNPTDENGQDVNREVLERLCAATGGRVFYPRRERDFEGAFAQIEEDLRRQYVLSFAPSAKSEEAFRTIKIEIRDRADLTVNHRLGYYPGSEMEGIKN